MNTVKLKHESINHELTGRELYQRFVKMQATAFVGREVYEDGAGRQQLYLIAGGGVVLAKSPCTVLEDVKFLVDRFVDVEIREV